MSRILELAERPQNIAGIYNYCDRWCVHRVYTDRCLVLHVSVRQDRARAFIRPGLDEGTS